MIKTCPNVLVNAHLWSAIILCPMLHVFPMITLVWLRNDNQLSDYMTLYWALSCLSVSFYMGSILCVHSASSRYHILMFTSFVLWYAIYGRNHSLSVASSLNDAIFLDGIPSDSIYSDSTGLHLAKYTWLCRLICQLLSFDLFSQASHTQSE